MAISVVRSLSFDTAHRLYGHEGKCANLHGHRYTADIQAQADQLDQLGRVIDFSVIKARIGGWLDKHWDHATILQTTDPLVCLLAKAQLPRPTYLMDLAPTAEHLADYLLRKICPPLLLNTGAKVVAVTLHETPNCYARAVL